jgi:hypothetical protein
MNPGLAEKLKFFRQVKTRLDPEDKSQYRAIQVKFVLGFLVSVAVLPNTLRISSMFTREMTGMRKSFVTVVINVLPALMINQALRGWYLNPFAEQVYQKYSVADKPDLFAFTESELVN